MTIAIASRAVLDIETMSAIIDVPWERVHAAISTTKIEAAG
ncbi:hypothetical protein [Actinoplanes sp. NBRC 103695]|nr:hypothetical protein [Actinoplanes sp. NBRC 103695]